MAREHGQRLLRRDAVRGEDVEAHRRCAYDAFAHPGDAAYPFSASVQEQLYRAWLVWKRDGGSWRAWGAVGAACSP